MKNLTILVVLITFLSACQSKTTQSEHADDTNSTEKWISLFDGKTLNGWKGFKTAEIPPAWSVVDGMLMTSGEGGDLAGDILTIDQFEDFELYLEWAIAEGGNSGVFYRVLEHNYPTVYATGPEYQLIDDEGFSYPLENWQKTASNYAMHDAEEGKVLKPVGEFNTSRIKVKDRKVTHWLNGVKLLEFEMWNADWNQRVDSSKWKDYEGYGKAIKGHIGLQDHGSKIQFRNIKIKDLTDKGQNLIEGNSLDQWTPHGNALWIFEGEELVCMNSEDKGYSYLATKKEYDDFILHIKFKQEANGNSGVFFRSVLNGTNIRGWQAEVAPKNHDSGGIYESGGRGWLHQIPDDMENILKENDWNEMILDVRGNRAMVWLNGELMTDIADDKIGEGKGVIALQVHEGDDVKIRWKDIFIRRLETRR